MSYLFVKASALKLLGAFSSVFVVLYYTLVMDKAELADFILLYSFVLVLSSLVSFGFGENYIKERIVYSLYRIPAIYLVTICTSILVGSMISLLYSLSYIEFLVLFLGMISTSLSLYYHDVLRSRGEYANSIFINPVLVSLLLIFGLYVSQFIEALNVLDVMIIAYVVFLFFIIVVGFFLDSSRNDDIRVVKFLPKNYLEKNKYLIFVGFLYGFYESMEVFSISLTNPIYFDEVSPFFRFVRVVMFPVIMMNFYVSPIVRDYEKLANRMPRISLILFLAFLLLTFMLFFVGDTIYGLVFKDYSLEGYYWLLSMMVIGLMFCATGPMFSVILYNGGEKFLFYLIVSFIFIKFALYFLWGCLNYSHLYLVYLGLGSGYVFSLRLYLKAKLRLRVGLV